MTKIDEKWDCYTHDVQGKSNDIVAFQREHDKDGEEQEDERDRTYLGINTFSYHPDSLF